MSDSLSKAIEQLRQEMASWSSIELRVHKDQELHNTLHDPHDPFIMFERHYIETAAGQRFFDDIMTAVSGNKYRIVAYCDGDHCARVRYAEPDGVKQAHIDIKESFGPESQVGGSYRPDPFYLYYIGRTPIFEALQESHHPLGSAEVLDRDCDLFLFTGVPTSTKPMDKVYYLDRETSTPLRIEAYPAGSKRDPDDLVQVWEAKSLDRVQDGHYFPLNSELRSFRKTDSGRVLAVSNTITVDQIRYDHAFDAKTFWPTYEPGVLVVDTIKKTSFTVPGARAEPRTAKPSDETKASTTIPVRAEQPTTLWTTVASTSLLGVGAALIVAAAVYRIKNR